MALPIKTPIIVVNAIAAIRRWQALEYQRNAFDEPNVRILIQTYQDIAHAFGLHWIQAYDDKNSLCLFVNPTPVGIDDQLLLGYRQIPNAYTAISKVYDEVNGTSTEKLLAIEPVLLTLGLLDPAFG